MKACLLLLSVPVLLLAAPSARAQIVSEFYVPIPENEALESLDDVNSGTDDPVQTYISMTLPNDCVVTYDHWEDGYESDLVVPGQGSTQVWGNGIDGDGVPPGFGSDPSPLPGGTVLVLSNAITTGMTTGDEDPNAPGADAPLQSTIDFDGRDRLGSTCSASMTRAAWGDTGTVNAGAAEVWPIADWGTSYVLPIGENTPSDDADFEVANVSILASEDGTAVDIDHDGDGTVDVSVTLNQGETYYLDSTTLAVNQGGTITASARVQVDMLTGDASSSYEGRWYAILPQSSWDSCYYGPTNSQPRAGGGTALVRVFLFNPGPGTIDVDTTDGNGATSTLTIAAGGVQTFDMPTDSVGVEFCSADGTFYAGAAVDHGNVVHDWGYYMIPQALLTNQLLIPWADGCDPTISCTQNGSPIWVTPVCDTYVYADFDQDGSPDRIDLNGDGDTTDTVDGFSEATSDQGLLLSALDRLLLHDPDGSQTGALIYTLDGPNNSGDMGCDLAGVWGQNAAVASTGSPAIDVGTLVVPFGADLRIEKATNGADADTPAEAIVVAVGAPVTWTYVVTNTGDFTLEDVTVTDDQLAPTSIACDASSVGSGSDTNGDNVIDTLEPGEVVTCTATGTATLGAYQNTGAAVGTPVGTTGLPILFPVGDMDPSNYLGVTYDLAIDKMPPTLANDADFSGTVTEGDTLAWDIEVTNAGSAALTGVTVSDDTADTLACQRTDTSTFDHVGGDTLAPGETIECVATYVVASADALAGQVVNTATTDSNETPPATDMETTPVVPPFPVGITVAKSALPVAVVAPGGDVSFTFVVTNLSPVGPVEITTLTDSVFGDLNGQGSCSVPQVIPALGTYHCQMIATVSGTAGDSHINVVTASGTDQTTSQPVSGTDPAEVLIVDSIQQACKHACPSKVKFRGDGRDFFATEAKLALPFSFNPAAELFTVTLSNANGVIYESSLQPGDLEKKGRKYQFKDKTAKKGPGPGLRDGLFKVQLKFSKDGLWRAKIRAFSDLTAATLPEMTMAITIDGQVFERTNVWSQVKKGWVLKRLD